MGLTTNFRFPYPEPTDSVDVVRDVKALADANDATTYDLALPRTASGSSGALSGAETDIVILPITTGTWSITVTATCDWSITGSIRYHLSVKGTDGAVIGGTQVYIGSTLGTVPIVLQVVRYVAAVAGNIRFTAYQAGVTGGGATLANAIVTARKVA